LVVSLASILLRVLLYMHHHFAFYADADAKSTGKKYP